MARLPLMFVALCGLSLAAYLGAPANAALWLYELPLIAAIVAFALRIRMHHGPVRTPWILFGAGLVLWLGADVIWNVRELRGDQTYPSLADAVYLAGYPLMMGSMIRAARLRAAKSDSIVLIDGLIVAAAAALPVYVYWIGPALADSSASSLAALVSLAYPVMDLGLLACLVSFTLGSGYWPRTTWIFMGGVILTIAGDIAFNIVALRTGATDVRATDVAWLGAFTLWGVSALSTRGDTSFRVDRRPSRSGLRSRTTVIGAIVALPLAVVADAYVRSEPIGTLTLGVTLTAISLLLVARLALMARRGDAAWQGAAILSSVAMLTVVVAVGLTHTNAAGGTQDKIAAQLEDLSANLQRADGRSAKALAASPAERAAIVASQVILYAQISREISQLPIPERDAIMASANAWQQATVAQVPLAPNNAAAIRQAVTSVVTARGKLFAQVNAAATRYRQDGAASARHGRLVAVGVIGAALIALWLLMLRFGAVSRRADVAEERSRAVRESEDRVRALLGATADLLTVIDPTTRVLSHRDQVDRVLGLPDDASELHLDSFLDPTQADVTREELAAIVDQPGARTRLDWDLHLPGGHVMHAEVSAVNHSSDPRIGGIVLSVRDVSERRRLEDALEHQALHDPLTGLPNRVLLADRLAQLLARGREEARAHALIMMDLDDFRAVNDSFGHLQGDALLTEVAARLQARATGHDTIARIGGDSFALLIEGVRSPDCALVRAEELLDAMEVPIRLEAGTDQLLRASIGITVGDGYGEGSPQEQASLMFRDAELAMYEAKRQEGNSAELFAPHMHDAVTHRLALRSEMVVALREEQFLLHYQPIVELRTRRIVGYEALVRWMHPERGMVSPGDFIPVAEQSGLIVELGDWVLREATRQLAEWQTGWDDERYVAVNVAGQQLERPDHLQLVREALEASGLSPRQLVLEMTESSLIHDTEASIERLNALRGLGVRLAIDDFGTGYSSLNYLHRFAVDVLKVDKSFVDDVADGDRGGALVDAIVTMARRLGLTVVAEGIEELEQVDALTAMLCANGQGFHFSRPLPARDVPDFGLADAMRRVA